jgi:hypothetical protein
MVALQSVSGAVHRLMAEHYPADFPPSLFIHTGLGMLESSTQVSEEIRANVLLGVFNHLSTRHGDAALDHADLIHLAVLTLRNRGAVLPCAAQYSIKHSGIWQHHVQHKTANTTASTS